MNKFGTKTPKAKVYKSESHKLHQAFPVANNVVINEGAPVQLQSNGEITNYSTGIYLGVSTSFSTDSPYPSKEQTVMVKGFAIVRGKADAAIAAAGYVSPTTTVDDDGYTMYEASASGAVTPFIALTPAAEGDLVEILFI